MGVVEANEVDDVQDESCGLVCHGGLSEVGVWDVQDE